MHLKVNTCHLYPRNDLFLILGWSRISIQDFTADSDFSCFSMDKIKASQLGNWEILFPIHPPLFFLHFIGLACYLHLLDKSLMLFPTREVLDRFGKCFLPHMGVFYILVSQPFWALWVVSIQLDFPMRYVLFMYTIIHHYSMEGYTPIFIYLFMWFGLFSSL